MKLLISVRSVSEALMAARAGADFIDLKEPRDGALGRLPLDTIRDIVLALRQRPQAQLISATIGDVPVQHVSEIQSRVRAVSACGVDIVKVGINVDASAADAAAVLQWLAGCGTPLVPLFIADAGLQPDLIKQALALDFYAVMLDTADKVRGSLFDCLPLATLTQFVQQARHAGVRVGLAGALRQKHLPLLQQLAPDWVGFRGAVCEANQRGGALCATRLAALRAALPAAPQLPHQHAAHPLDVLTLHHVDGERNSSRQLWEPGVEHTTE